MPWRRWQQIGLGILGWQPKVFWKSTVMELYSALEGYNESQTGENKSSTAPSMNRKVLEEMMERFPDHG